MAQLAIPTACDARTQTGLSRRGPATYTRTEMDTWLTWYAMGRVQVGEKKPMIDVSKMFARNGEQASADGRDRYAYAPTETFSNLCHHRSLPPGPTRMDAPIITRM